MTASAPLLQQVKHLLLTVGKLSGNIQEKIYSLVGLEMQNLLLQAN
jgi:hypothetical protein